MRSSLGMILSLALLVPALGAYAQSVETVDAAGCILRGFVTYVQLTEGFWQVWVADLESGSFKQVTHSPSDKRYPRWHKGASSIVFRTAGSEVFGVDPETGGETQLYPTLGRMLDIRFSPDGKKAAFARIRENVVDDVDLWLLEEGHDEAELLVSEAGLQYAPAWSPDGSKIVFVSGQGHNTHELVLMNLATREQRKLTVNQSYDVAPVFSPDGRRIFFSSNRTGDYELWELEPDTGETRQLTQAPGLDIDPVFSPDGEWLAYTRAEEGEMKIALMCLRDHSTRILETKSEARDPDWR